MNGALLIHQRKGRTRPAAEQRHEKGLPDLNSQEGRLLVNEKGYFPFCLHEERLDIALRGRVPVPDGLQRVTAFFLALGGRGGDHFLHLQALELFLQAGEELGGHKGLLSWRKYMLGLVADLAVVRFLLQLTGEQGDGEGVVLQFLLDELDEVVVGLLEVWVVEYEGHHLQQQKIHVAFLRVLYDLFPHSEYEP